MHKNEAQDLLKLDGMKIGGADAEKAIRECLKHAKQKYKRGCEKMR